MQTDFVYSISNMTIDVKWNKQVFLAEAMARVTFSSLRSSA